MSSKLKVLSNVFINTGGNKLKLVDFFFDEKIVQIIPKMMASVLWDEISTQQRKEAFINKLGLKKQMQNPTMIDGEYLLAMPGAVDSHVHFNTPGFEQREDFEHGSLAAAFGGTTVVIDMPCTSIPPVTNVQNLQSKLQMLEKRSFVDYALWGGVSGNDFDVRRNVEKQIYELAKSSVAGFKAYLTSGMDSFKDLTKMQMQVIAGWIAETKKTLAVHAEDKELFVGRMEALKREGKNDWKAYCTARDEGTEAQAIKNMVDVAKRSNCRILIVHLSSKLGLNLVRKAKEAGLNISAETCPHYLYFTQKDFENEAISNLLKTAPPVKMEQDKEALWEGLRDGSISFVNSDHAGCDPELEKNKNNFWDVYGGIPGVEHRVPFLFSEGFLKRRLSLEQTINLLSVNAIQYFGIKKKGKLDLGYDADIALIDLWNSEEVLPANMHTKFRHTPFQGKKFDAIVERTILRGKIVAVRKNNSEVTAGYGNFINIFGV